MNPELRIILTVSPVPLVATASGHHVLSASTYSKSVLRVAAEEVATQQHGVVYFPSYEIVTGPQAPESFFEADRRNVSQSGVEAVMAAFLSRCEGRAEDSEAAPRRELAQPSSDRSSELSKLIVEAECEEAMADRGLTG